MVPVTLNHTIVPSTDKVRSSQFLADVLGLAPPAPVSHFMALALANGVTLDFDDADEFSRLHFAFLVTDAEFDAAFDRVCAAGIVYFADPSHRYAGQINTRAGGRGFYFDDPDGHNMEVFTKPPL